MKLVYGGYGHYPSGYQYVYWASDSTRIGQNLNVPVTNKKSGKTYNTMFTVVRTSGKDSSWVDKETGLNKAETEAMRLQGEGINIKTVNGTDVMTLPGAKSWESKREWAEWSSLVREEKINERLSRFKNSSADLTEPAKRLTRNFATKGV